MVTFKTKGDWRKTHNFVEKARYHYYLNHLDKFGEEGVRALSLATPKDTGATASSWYYQIRETRNGVVIEWLNRNIQDYVNIALILQYGHATGGKHNRGYVAGYDYINPAMRPIFDKIAQDAWNELNDYSAPIGANFN